MYVEEAMAIIIINDILCSGIGQCTMNGCVYNGNMDKENDCQ